MTSYNEHRTRPGKMVFAQDRSEGGRQNPAAAAVAELMGTPLYGEVLQEMRRLQRYGVTPTAEMVETAIKLVRSRYRPEPVTIPVATANPPAQTRKSNGRFSLTPDVGPVVYYMRIGDRVKIGMTTNLRGRLEAINPEELLALEKGGRAVERERHERFKDLRTHGEWFRLEGPLLEYINQLRADQ